VRIFYANNEVFNPHPANISTNEWPGTFPSRRAAFMIDHCTDIHLANLTIMNTAKGQAEGLLINGERILVSRVTIVGSGDALQSNGTVYFTDSQLTGDGDTILGRGAGFFNQCTIYSQGPFMWVRNTEASHGYVFLHCVFKTPEGKETVLARCPANGGRTYPYSEAVLIECRLLGISPEGWGPVEGETDHIHYWEFHSVDLKTGKPIDTSRRHPASRQLDTVKDAELIRQYSQPAFILNGWNPQQEML